MGEVSKSLENRLQVNVQSIIESEVSSSPLTIIYFVLSGSVRVFHNGRVLELKKGEIYLISPFDFVRLTAIESNQVLVTSAHINEQYELGRPLSPFYMQDAYNRISHVLSAIFIELESKKSGYEEIVQGNLFRLIGIFKRYLKVSNRENHNTYITSKTQEVVKYINENYSSKLSLEELSTQFFINKYYLSHSFKEQMGMTVGNYIKEIRLSHAHILLQQTSEKIMSIAFDTGFPNVRSFSSSFKAKYGLTPKEYRQKLSLKHEDQVEEFEGIEYSALRFLNEYAGEDGMEKFDNRNTRQMSVQINSLGEVKKLPSKYLFARLKDVSDAQALGVIKQSTGIKFVSIDRIADYISIKEVKGKKVVDHSTIMTKLKKVIQNNLIPYIQISFVDYEILLKQHLTRDEFYSCFQQLSYDIQREFIDTQDWKIEFRCFYEMHNKGEVCEPVKDIITFFGWVGSLVIHLPVQPDTVKIDEKSHVYVIDDMATIKAYPLNDILEILSKPKYTQIIGENKNIKLQNDIANRMDYLEHDVYYQQFTELIYANQMLWLFLEGINRDARTFEPVSIEGTPLFTYFSRSVSRKLSLVNEDGIKKVMWFAYDFRSNLFEDVIFHNEYMIITKRGENFRILTIYPEKEVINAIFQTNITKQQEPLTQFNVTFGELSGEYQIIEKKITPELQNKYINQWKGIDSKKLSSKNRGYIDGMSQPEITIQQKSINKTLKFSVSLPIFGVSFVEINKL